MVAPKARSGARQESPGKRNEPAPRQTPGGGPERPGTMLAAERSRERQARWMIVGVSVALAVIAPIARQVWRWLWEDRTRARLDREILRELGA